MAKVGEWMTQQVIGERVANEISARAPVTVVVTVPSEADFLMHRPLELAQVNGTSLVSGGVSLVFAASGPASGMKTRVEKRLRVLAAFSLPRESSVLALRSERYHLARLVRQLRARSGRAIDFRVLQYGVTRQRLAAAMQEGEGWDVIHMSGHGLADGFLLEKADGSSDLIETTELAEVFEPARQRVKLVVLSSCQSGAATAAQTLQWLRLPGAAEPFEAEAGLDRGKRVEGVPALARALVDRLDTAVLAMRFPVRDDFATRFSDGLYEMLFARGQTLSAAARYALGRARDAVGLLPASLSTGTPALFGNRAAELVLEPPALAAARLDVRASRMDHFKPEPPRFVGRAEAMARATAALAPESTSSGVLFHGMAGAGKTTCALELSYGHAEVFAGGMAFWTAPEGRDEAIGAIDRLAQSLEIQLGPELGLVDAVASLETLRAYGPRLKKLLESNGVLIVLDNLESLLTDERRWRDPRWYELVPALTAHGGFSRVILTSRVVPAGLESASLLVLPVHSLSLAESAVLARELPHLGALLHASAQGRGESSASCIEADRALLLDVLTVVQGHPKLLELADAQARDLPTLRARLVSAKREAAAEGRLLESFITTGETTLDDRDFWATIESWTRAALAELSEDGRLLLEILCCVEGGDRNSTMLRVNWADVWRRVGRTREPADVGAALGELDQAALVERHIVKQGREGVEAFVIHPAVVETVRAVAPSDLQPAVDVELAAYWYSVARAAIKSSAVSIVARAGLAAAPYLIRMQNARELVALLERSLNWSSGPLVARQIVSVLRPISGQEWAAEGVRFLLARALARFEPDEAEAMLRATLSDARDGDEPRHLIAALAGLESCLVGRGSLVEALELNAEKKQTASRAGFGPWTMAAIEADRLRILLVQGRSRVVLDEVRGLLPKLPSVDEDPSGEETVEPWNVSLTLLSLGHAAASSLQEWTVALEFGAASQRIQHQRGASAHSLAETKFNDHAPLIALGRLDEAERILDECQSAFEQAEDLSRLGAVFGARARLESERGHVEAARDLERVSLRYAYQHGNVEEIVDSHQNLGAYEVEAGRGAVGVLHEIAGVMVELLAGIRGKVGVRNLAITIGRDDVRPYIPQSAAELAERLGEEPGIRFAELVESMAPQPEDREAFFRAALDAAHQSGDPTARAVRMWRPIILQIVGSVGRGAPSDELEARLLDLAGHDDWAPLTAAIRRVVSGELDSDDLRAGLDQIDNAILDDIFARLQDPARGDS